MAHRPGFRPSAKALLASVLLCSTVVGVVRRAQAADDIDLLRENGGTPFVMVLVDTSASMNLNPPASQQGSSSSDFGDLSPADADDKGSKLFAVKEALYEALYQVDNVHFGIATFNKDLVRVRAKHWLYVPEAAATFETTPAFTYPAPPPYELSSLKANWRDIEKTDNMSLLKGSWVFGAQFNAGVAGSCANPIDFDQNNGDIKLNRFPKLGVMGLDTTTLWLETSNTTYRLQVRQTPGVTARLGSPTLSVDLELTPVHDCGSPDAELSMTRTIQFKEITDFIMVETDVTGASKSSNPGVHGAPAIYEPKPETSLCTSEETVAGFWQYQDMAAINTCGNPNGSSQPFTGRGWDANSDSPGSLAGAEDLDTYPKPLASCSESDGCYDVNFPTVPFPNEADNELDFGDVIPLDWEVDYREEFLRRVNPLHPDFNPSDEDSEKYFGVAGFFQDTPDSSGLLKLKHEDARPLLAYGNSPLGRAINDFRCWVLGTESNTGQGKCRATPFDPGWNALYRLRDKWYQCRVPYLIVITDGEENSSGENPTADISDFKGEGFKTIVFTFNDNPNLRSTFNFKAGDGQIILVQDESDLETQLKAVIGDISQASRTFATAAVPSVQSAVESQIYLTKFNPFNNRGVWQGHLHSFLRPLDPTKPPDSTNPAHLWDAAAEMLNQAPVAGDTDLKVGPTVGAGGRRVFYSELRKPNVSSLASWPENRQYFLRTNTDDPNASPSAGELDFWDAFQLPFDTADSSSIVEARRRANAIVEQTLVQKDSPVGSNNPPAPETPDPDWLPKYVLGEIFHSNPLVVGSPTNTRYFAVDAEETFDTNGDPKGTGYQDFFEKLENRRKVVIAGANDGELHAFDAGTAGVVTGPTEAGKDIRFTVGTGREIFSYIPREVFPTVKTMAENPESHRWSVDGAVAGGDVFIDPNHVGTPDPAKRRWRTVVVGGLREGGSGYYALDITQPDELTTTTIGPPGGERTVFVPQKHPSGTSSTVPVGTPGDFREKAKNLTYFLPDCVEKTGDGEKGCDSDIKYASPLWEFEDDVWDSTIVNDDGSKGAYVRLDEDANGRADLGETWSTPDIGRMQVLENGQLVRKYVAVFGGGLDPAKVGSRGNFLYIVDTETGQTLYKKELEGSAVGDAAAVDTDQDSFIDRIYIGTDAGYLYRVDLTAVDSSGTSLYPALGALGADSVTGLDKLQHDVARIGGVTDPNAALWLPKKIFDTEGLPLFFPPAVLFVSNLGEYALALGTGDRDDLTAVDSRHGRIYAFVDESSRLDSADLPMTAAKLTEVGRDSGDHADLLTDPTIPVGHRGWFITLLADERMIGQPFGFSGVSFFATFLPVVQNDGCDVSDSSCKTGPLCRLNGTSFVYVLGTTDADRFLTQADGTTPTRFHEIPNQFVTSPFTEQAVTRSQDTSGTGTGDQVADALTESEQKLLENLKSLFPKNCKFGNHRIDIKVIRADTKLERVATVPICIIEKNWKEVSE